MLTLATVFLRASWTESATIRRDHESIFERSLKRDLGIAFDFGRSWIGCAPKSLDDCVSTRKSAERFLCARQSDEQGTGCTTFHGVGCTGLSRQRNHVLLCRQTVVGWRFVHDLRGAEQTPESLSHLLMLSRVVGLKNDRERGYAIVRLTSLLAMKSLKPMMRNRRLDR